jgi:glutathione synthase/RimK-type ligase-like ATP-grasp enzyme
MAIFSQGDNKTSLDFRRYNRSFENRKVPFQLPEIIEEKLNGLFNALNLNCGSIDLIFTSNDEYLFLEINPVGQFGMVSFPCNYHLEKIIAEYL